MNWLVFAVFGCVALMAQVGLKPIWLIELSAVGDLSPSVLLVLLVYIGLHAPTWPVMWAALAMGLAAEVTATPMPDAVLLGPRTLGFLAGAYAILQLRSMVFRESLLAFLVLVLIVGLFVELVTVALLTARGIPWPLGEPIPGWSAADELVHRFLELLYTAGLAIPLGLLLFRTRRAWGFTGKTDRWP